MTKISFDRATRAGAWACLLLALAYWALPAAAAPVTLDTTFGVGGRATSNFRGGFDQPFAAVQDESGRHYYASISELTGASNALDIVRVTPSGALDPTFGDGGITTVVPVNDFIYAGGMTIDGDGRILVVFDRYGEFCNSFGVTRLTPSGAIDASFGTGGTVFVDPGGTEFGSCGFVDATGIAWNGQSGVDYRFAVSTQASNAAVTTQHGTIAQFLENGTLDSSFGGNGIVQLAVGTASVFHGLAYDFIHIVAWGSRTMGTTDTLFAGFGSDGSRVGNFGTFGGADQGYTVTNFGGNSAAYAYIATNCPQFGGYCFYLTGSAVSGGAKQMYVARYVGYISGCTSRGGITPCLHNGTAAFDGDGFALVDLGGSSADDEGWAIGLQSGADYPNTQSVVAIGTSAPTGSFGVGAAITARFDVNGAADNAYDGNGIVENVLGTTIGPRAFGTADDNGVAFVAGRGMDGTLYDTVIGRRTGAGANDPAFGGVKRIRTANASSSAADLALDANRPLVVGLTRNQFASRFEIAAARFTASGARDTAFDGDGQASFARAGDTFSEANAVAVQEDGKAVIAGATGDVNGNRLTVLRLNPNGSLDTGFGTMGYFRLEGVGFSSQSRDVLIDPSGRIVVLGNVSDGSSNDVVVVGLTSGGALDAFGPGNIGYTRFALASNDGAAEIRAYPGGGYAIAGTAVTAGNSRTLLLRLDASGLPVGTFGSNGAFTDGSVSGNVNANALALDALGRFYVAGGLNGAAPILTRFSVSGGLDTGWGQSNGIANLGGFPGFLYSVDLDASGRPLASGVASLPTGSTEMVVYRPLGDGSAPDSDFNTTGRATVAFTGFSQATAQVVLADGSILLAGSGNGQLAIAKLATRAASSAAVSIAPNPGQYNQNVTFTAAVTGGAGTATGMVTIFAGATSIGSGALNGAGIATITASDLEVGSYSVTAAYSGDASYAPDTSDAVAFTVNKAATTSTLTNLDMDGQSASGENISLKFDVAGAFGTVPGGSVQLFVDGNLDGSYAIFNGTTTITTDDLQPGTHALSFVYQGDQRHAQSTSNTVMHTVGKATSGTSLGVQPSPSMVGQNVTMTAAVGGSAGVPVTGMVEFRDGMTLLATVAVDMTGSAVYSTSALAGGSHSLRAVYLGSDAYNGSQSTVVNHTVGGDIVFANGFE